MLAPPFPDDEAERLAATRALELLDAPPQEAFDRIARTAARGLDVPVAYVSLIEDERQWVMSCVGMDGGDVDREISFCGHTILRDEPLVLPDARLDARFADNPFVTGDFNLVAYAGIPLHDPLTGHKVGTLCVVDHRPRHFDAAMMEALHDLAAWAESEFARVHLGRVAAELDDERDRAQRAARRSDLLLQAVAEGIFGLDRAGRVTFVNRAGAALLGRTQDELVGAHLHELAHHARPDGSPLPWEECPTARTLADGRARRLTDEAYLRADGTWFPVETSQTPITSGGEVTGAVLVLQDISERRAVERVKSEFVSTVSHELRTPLTAVKGSLGLLAGGVYGQLPPRAQEMVEVGSRNADRLIRLINDILDLERLTSGRASLELRRVDVAEVVDDALAGLAATAAAAGVSLAQDVEHAALLVDQDRLVQVLTNLVGNAVKFSDAGGTVRVEGGMQDARHYALRVVDTGRGIPAEHVPTIFQRFTQVDASDAREHGGTGLGLSIVQALVEAHDGSVWVESALGEGTTFHVTLPAADDAVAAVAALAVDPHGEVHALSIPELLGRATGHVLVIEDDEDVAGQVASMLGSVGCTTSVARGEAEAIAAIESATPDAIVLDLRLSEGDGYGIVRWLAANRITPRLPLVVFTVLDEDDVDRSQLAYGHPVVLTKSESTLQDLADRVRTAMAADTEEDRD